MEDHNMMMKSQSETTDPASKPNSEVSSSESERLPQPSAPNPATAPRSTDVSTEPSFGQPSSEEDEQIIVLNEHGDPLPPPMRPKANNKTATTAVIEAVPSLPSPLPSAHAVSVGIVAVPEGGAEEEEDDEGRTEMRIMRQKRIIWGLLVIIGVLVVAVVALAVDRSATDEGNGNVVESQKKNGEEEVLEQEEEKGNTTTVGVDGDYAALPVDDGDALPTESPSKLPSKSPSKSYAEALNPRIIPILQLSDFASSRQTMYDYAHLNGLSIIRGYVWIDGNANGFHEGSFMYGTDHGLLDAKQSIFELLNGTIAPLAPDILVDLITVNLYECEVGGYADDVSANVLKATTSTDGFGQYAFVGVPPGRYYLTFGMPTSNNNFVFTMPDTMEYEQFPQTDLAQSNVVNQYNGTTDCMELGEGNVGWVNAGYVPKVGSPVESNYCPVPDPCPVDYGGYVTCPGSHYNVFVMCSDGKVVLTHDCPLGFTFDEAVQGCKWT